MKIWLDTTEIHNIQKAVRLGILAGVTTNPSLVAASHKTLEEVLEELLHHQQGPVAAQVVGDHTKDMVQQGQNLYKFSTRIIVKVPISKNGLEAIHLLSRQGIPTMATVLYTPHQCLMAALAGANYLAPYLSRIEQAGQNPWTILNSMTKILENYNLKTHILGASINHVEHVSKCAEEGIYGVTVKDPIFEQLIDDYPLTTQGVNQFKTDWKLVHSPLFMT